MLSRWLALTRVFDDSRIGLGNNPAQLALPGVAVGRKNHLFAGSDWGAERAAAFYTLIETAKLNGLDTEAYLRDVLAGIADQPVRRLVGQAEGQITPLKLLKRAMYGRANLDLLPRRFLFAA